MSAYGYTFGRVPDGLLFSDASDRACRLYAILTRYADQHVKGDPPTRPQLAAYLDCSVDSLDRAVKELVQGGWLEVLPRSSKRSEKVRDANDYRLLSGSEDGGVAARVRLGGSRTGAATRTSANDETAGNGSRTRAARGSRTGAATYKEVVKTDSERGKTNGATAPDHGSDDLSLFQAEGLPDGSPGSHGSPSPHGAAPPPPTASQNGHSSKKADTAKIVQRVFEAWQEATDSLRAKLTDARRSKITARLREGYTEEQLICVVTDGWRADPWPGRVDNNDLVILLRDGPQVEKFLKLAAKARLAANGSGHHLDPEEELRRAREFNARQEALQAAARSTQGARP